MAKKAMKKQFDKKKTKLIRTKARIQHMVRSQKYPIEMTFKEVGLEKI